MVQMPALADSLLECFHGVFSTVGGLVLGRWTAMVLIAEMLLQLCLNWHKNSSPVCMQCDSGNQALEQRQVRMDHQGTGMGSTSGCEVVVVVLLC